MRRSGQRKNRAALLEKWATRHGYSGDAPEDEVGAALASAKGGHGDASAAASAAGGAHVRSAATDPANGSTNPINSAAADPATATSLPVPANLSNVLQAQLLQAQHEREAARAELERAQSAAAAESESLKDALNTLASQLVETKIAMATAARDGAHGASQGEGPLDAPLALPTESILGVRATPELLGTPRKAGGIAVDAAGSPGDVDRDRLRDLLVTKLSALQQASPLQPSLERPAKTTSATPGTARLMEAADSEIADARTWRQLMSGGLHTEQQQQQQQQQIEQRAGVTWLAGAEEQVDGALQSNSTQCTTTQIASQIVAASSPATPPATPVSNPDPLPGRSEGGQGGARPPASTLQRASGREEDLEKRKWDLLQKLSHAHHHGTSPTHGSYGSYPRNSPFLAKQRKLLETMSALSKFIPSIPNNPAVNMHNMHSSVHVPGT